MQLLYRKFHIPFMKTVTLNVVWQSQTQARPKHSARVWSQAYIAICTRCRNIAVQSDCRTCNYNILTSSENGRLYYSRGFIKRCVVANTQKVFEKQADEREGGEALRGKSKQIEMNSAPLNSYTLTLHPFTSSHIPPHTLTSLHTRGDGCPE